MTTSPILARSRLTRPTSPNRLERRAMALWPRLEMAALRRCGGDPWRIAALVSRRTMLPAETIRAMLLTPEVSVAEGETWFG